MTGIAGDAFYGRNATALAAAADDPQRLWLAPAAAATLRRRAHAAAPRECCGVLAGRDDRGTDLRVELFVELPNGAVDRERFAVDPVDFLAARRRLAAAGLRVLGFAHSHPGGRASPSPVDHRELWPDCVHLIAAPQRDGSCPLRAYWFRGGVFAPLVLP